MEKFGNKPNSKSRDRLLSVFFIINLATTLAAQNRLENNFYDLQKPNEIAKISEKSDFSFEAIKFTAAENQNFFVNEDLNFYLHFPSANPSQIELKSYKLPQNAQFKMLRKTENHENGGTKIDLWLNFKTEGVFEIEDFVFSMKNRDENLEIRAKIPKIAIKKDISKESPKIVIVFENGNSIYYDNDGEFFAQSQFQEEKTPIFQIEEGEKLNFTVCAQFSKKILSFDYEIPKNAIFKQTEFFDYKNRAEFSDDFFSEELLPLGRFELTGLTGGIEEFPAFFLQTENFRGENEEIKFSGFFIEFLKSGKSEKIAEKNIYGEAFAQINEAENRIEVEKKELTYEECEKLAQKLKNNRVKKLILIFFPIFAFFAAAFLLVLKKIQTKKTVAAVFVALFASLAVVFFVSISKNNEGIFTGGKVYGIPDENSGAQTEYPAGEKIKLLEKTENWIFIKIEENFGWCKKENAII